MSIKIGIIGLGTVGQGVYDIIRRRKDSINSRIGGEIIVKYVCDKRSQVKEELNISENIFTSDYNNILTDDEISLIVLLTGDVELAFKIIKECFAKGKHVVTANKALLAAKWIEIFKLARECKCLIYFEASVGSGIPVIQGINEGLAANDIKEVIGILNGTTNYILTQMSSNGNDFKDALQSAVSAGFAEPNSSSDISGLDAAHKIAILSNVINRYPVALEDIYYEGIDELQIADIDYAKEMFGYLIKLISVMRKRADGFVEIRVHPAFLPKGHMLSSVNNEFNGILVNGDSVGQVMFYGKGAGRYPAASAVVSDIIYLAQKINYDIAGNIPYIHSSFEKKTKVCRMDDLEFKYYVRFTTVDRPKVLSKITGILGNYEVSIASCFQKDHAFSEEVPIVMITHKANEGKLKKALAEIDELDIIKDKSVFIRIES